MPGPTRDRVRSAVGPSAAMASGAFRSAASVIKKGSSGDMIYVDDIPEGCVCGWLVMKPSEREGRWRLVRPHPLCHFLDHHAKESYTQPTLDGEPEWEVGA